MKYQSFLKNCHTLNPQGRALDVGAGPGVVAALLVKQQPHLHITALDISPHMIEAGKDYIRDKNLGDCVDFVQGDVEDNAFLNTLGTFDFIYSTYTLHHWHDPKPVIARLLQLLNAGGTLYLYDLRRAWWLYSLPFKGGFFTSIRSAYLAPEVHDMLQEMNIPHAEVNHVFPFLLSVIIHKK
jgi:ubiquinone/menaquinone biosynthesis C-methylase UbiE